MLRFGEMAMDDDQCSANAVGIMARRMIAISSPSLTTSLRLNSRFSKDDGVVLTRKGLDEDLHRHGDG